MAYKQFLALFMPEVAHIYFPLAGGVGVEDWAFLAYLGQFF